MAKSVRKYIDSCIVCKASKGPSGAQQARLHPIPKVSIPWHMIHIDFTGKLSGKSDKKEYASVIIDGFTKYVLLQYTTSIDANFAVIAIKKAVCLFGSPKRVIADQGRCYISQEFRVFCREHNIELHLIATGSSRANGQVERVMRTLKSLLCIIENDPHKVWRDELSNVQLALNSTRSRVTGYSPTELMFGVQALSLGESRISPRLNPDIRLNLETTRDAASRNIERVARSEVVRFNKGKSAVQPFREGDYVFIKCSERHQTKLDNKFKGPFKVTRVLENDRYELKNITGSNWTYKYSHENLRAVPEGYDGLAKISDYVMNDDNNDDETVTAVLYENDDDDSDTLSACSDTLSAVSDTLTASSYNDPSTSHGKR